jgi:hypothetical protein
MGTWGITAFEDDTAMDFYDSFCSDGQSVEQLSSLFDKVLNTEYNMDDLDLEGFTEPVRALVAAEIVAAVLFNPIDSLPDKEYHERGIPALNIDLLYTDINSDVVDKASATVSKLIDAKEIHLSVLWQESDSYEEWKTYLHDLISRLQ